MTYMIVCVIYKDNNNWLQVVPGFPHSQSDEHYSVPLSHHQLVRVLYWRSVTITLSSIEAEHIVLSKASQEASWLRNLCEELRYKQGKPTLMKGDNDSSIAMAKNPQFHWQSEHITTHWHWVWDLVKNDEVVIESCQDPEQMADVLTKVLAKPKHNKHAAEMGLYYAWGGVLGCHICSTIRLSQMCSCFCFSVSKVSYH